MLDDQAIPCEKWHLAELTELIDIPMDYFTFLQRKVSTEIYMGIYIYILYTLLEVIIVGQITLKMKSTEVLTSSPYASLLLNIAIVIAKL